MANTSASLGPHGERFIPAKLAEGRYASASELIHAGLRLLEEQEQKLERLRDLIREDEESGDARPRDAEAFKAEMRTKQEGDRGS